MRLDEIEVGEEYAVALYQRAPVGRSYDGLVYARVVGHSKIAPTRFPMQSRKMPGVEIEITEVPTSSRVSYHIKPARGKTPGTREHVHAFQVQTPRVEMEREIEQITVATEQSINEAADLRARMEKVCTAFDELDIEVRPNFRDNREVAMSLAEAEKILRRLQAS